MTNGGKQKKRLKAATAKKSSYYSDTLEWLITLMIMNYCYYMSINELTSYMMSFIYLIIANFVVARTLFLRNLRVPDSHINAIALETENNLKNNEEIQEGKKIRLKLEMCPIGNEQYSRTFYFIFFSFIF